MQSFRIGSVIAALAVLAPGAALAQFAAQRPVVDWRCDGDRCVGRAEGVSASRDILQLCRRTVRATGPVSQYRIGDRELSTKELRACNRFVIATQPPRN
jgi:hypothetical protein